MAQQIAACVTSGDDPAALLSRQNDLERQARERAWKAEGVKGASSPARLASLVDLTSALDDAALVELADIDNEIHVVVVVDGGCHHRRVASGAEVHNELGHLRLALRRLAYGGSKTALGTGAEAQLRRAAARLDGLLMSPIAQFLGSHPVVLVPTGELHATPWAALPTLAGRPLSLAPSARLWLEAASAGRTTARPGAPPPPERRAVVVAGPRLAGAEHEAVTIGSLYPSARVLTGPKAEVATVFAALEGAGTAHLAAHASFRADNGLWSSLELADGVLTVYELEQLRRPPQVVVLSACQSGLSAVRPGDEVMGLVAALLGLGARSVVASVVPVEDQASEQLMVALHGHLRAGEPPAVALAAAQADSPSSVGLSYACFGGA